MMNFQMRDKCLFFCSRHDGCDLHYRSYSSFFKILGMVPVIYALQTVLFSNISQHVKQTKQEQRTVTVLPTISQINCFHRVIFTSVGIFLLLLMRFKLIKT